MCFTIGWLVQILVELVVLALVFALIRIWILPKLAATDPRIPLTINWVLWAIVVIFVIYVVADLLICASAGGGGFGLGLPRTR